MILARMEYEGLEHTSSERQAVRWVSPQHSTIKGMSGGAPSHSSVLVHVIRAGSGSVVRQERIEVAGKVELPTHSVRRGRLVEREPTVSRWVVCAESSSGAGDARLPPAGCRRSVPPVEAPLVGALSGGLG